MNHPYQNIKIFNPRLIITILLQIAVAVNAQSYTAPETVSKYSIAQKRLLVINTFQFENFISQNNLDQDSIMTMACHITKMPLLLPYTGGFENNVSAFEDLINAGRTNDAIAQLHKLNTDKKIPLLIELATYYLHQPGIHKTDLDSALVFINAVSEICKTGVYPIWQTECLFLQAELYRQQQDVASSRTILEEIASSAEKENNLIIIARAYHQLGVLFPSSDSMQLLYYHKSFELYHQLQFKEKEIELLVDIALCDVHSEAKLMGNDLLRVSSLMNEIKFKHVLYTQNMLAYASLNQAVYSDALQYINQGIENVKWSGIVAVLGNFYYRVGSIYQALEKNEEALSWFNKALNAGTNETHIFWYKSLFFATGILIATNRSRQAISLVDSIRLKFPAITIWEKMQILSINGQCYGKLNNFKLADDNHMALLTLANHYPLADRLGELSTTYFSIAEFYLDRKDLKKCRLFLQQGQKNLSARHLTNANKYFLLSRLDSMEGNFKSALQNHILYKSYNDSLTNTDQQNKLEELTLKYAAEKKDQDIKLLQQQGLAQQAELTQNKLDRKIMIAGTILLLVIVGLLFKQFKLKQRTNNAISKKNLQLQHLLEEKEWLLKEVHHRVKNNLHTVISLLESQAAYLKDDALKAIENSQHRIYAMSLIHQRLYQTEDVKMIDMSVYIPEFIGYLSDSLGVQGQIVFSLDIEPLKLGVAQAIPVGLIINESITNAIKYAFPSGRRGTVKVIMYIKKNSISLSIADNGIGMNKLPLYNYPDTLGMKLLHGLSQDINGHMDIIVDGGTNIIIIFPADPLSDSNILNSHIKNDVYA